MTPTIKEAGHLKHPVSREKLQVVDRFNGGICLICNKMSTQSVTIVESDLSSIKHYLVISCSDCKTTDWYIFPAKT